MAASETAQPSKPEQSPPAKKSWREAVLTATPVVLTVVATILAGLSTSEMTLAQYHRSMAAQNQSKASDQWGFFQAKRIRGTAVQRTIRLLEALSDPASVETNSLASASDILLGDLGRIQAETGRFLAAIGPAKTELGRAATSLYESAARLK